MAVAAVPAKPGVQLITLGGPTIPGACAQRVLTRFFGSGLLSQSVHKGAGRSIDLMTNEPHCATLLS